MNKLLGSAKSRTMWFALLLAIAGELQANMGYLSDILTKEQFGHLGLGVAIAIAIFRWITTSGLSDK